MIPFAAYTATETSNAFLCQKLPLPIGDLDPYLIHGSLGPLSQPPIWQLYQFNCFYRAHHCAQQTGRHTDRQSTLRVTTDHIHAVHVMQPKTEDKRMVRRTCYYMTTYAKT